MRLSFNRELRTLSLSTTDTICVSKLKVCSPCFEACRATYSIYPDDTEKTEQFSIAYRIYDKIDFALALTTRMLSLKLSHLECHSMSHEILVIEDSYEDICFLDEILTTAGYTVRFARNGSQGLRAARYAPPDLILLDVMLPDVNGFEICREVRAEEKLAMVPVIFVSAAADINLKTRAFEEGGFDYIIKPYNSKEILIRVNHQIERISAGKKLEEHVRIKERSHIARELHDSVSQTLFVMGITAQSLMMETDKLPPELMAEATKLHTLSQSALVEMRTLLNELRPSLIANTPITKLINQLVDSYRLRINAEISLLVDVLELPVDIKLAFYRIIQEALNNIAKYASASTVLITFVDDEQVRLTIQDDGCGFDVSGVTGGMGLNSMKERAAKHGIEFTIASQVGKGTLISANWSHWN